MASKSKIAMAKRKPEVLASRRVRRCKLCGRPRGRVSQVRDLPHLLSQVGRSRADPWR